MVDAIKIYNSNEYKNFQFDDELVKIGNLLGVFTPFLICNNDHYIAPLSYLEKECLYVNDGDKTYQVAAEDIICKEVIFQQNLFYGKINLSNFTCVQTDSSIATSFKVNLLKEQIKWILNFLTVIADHLSDRESDHKILINQVSIRIMIADCIIKITQAKKALEKPFNGNGKNLILTNQELLMVANDLISAVQFLSRLAGGRAMLQENIISMQCIFRAFHNVYFQSSEPDGYI